jgi:hypothetical protein
MAQLIIDQIKRFETIETNPPPPIHLPQIEVTTKLTPVKLSTDQEPVPSTLEWEGSSEKKNQPKTTGHKESDSGTEQQEVRTSSRLRRQPGKMDTFLWSTQ